MADSGDFRPVYVWGPAFAILLMIVVGAGGWFVDMVQAMPAERAAAARSRCGSANDDCARQDLAAYARQAVASEQATDLAAWQVALSGLTLVGLVVTGTFAGLAWREAQNSAGAAQDANRLTREAFEADNRAWMELIGLQLQPPGLVWNNDEAKASFIVSSRNVGKSPARGVHVSLEFYFNFTAFPNGRRDEIIAQTSEAPGSIGYTVFPTRDYDQPIEIHITQDKIAAVRADMEKAFGPGLPKSNVMPLFLIGVLSYFPLNSMSRRHTAFIYQVQQAPAPGLVPMMYTDYPPNGLSLVRWFVEDVVAT